MMHQHIADILPLFSIAPLVAGALVGAGASILSGQQQNKWNRDAANTSMEWQEHMSNTAHQREVKDLKAAGLNPILSAGGSGASTGSGAMPSMVGPAIDLPGIMQAFSVAQQDKQLDQNQQKIAQDQQRVDNESKRVNNETMATAATISQSISQTKLNEIKKLMEQENIKAKKAGSMSNFLGTEVYDRLKNPITMPKMQWLKDALKSQQPRRDPPSSGGEINSFSGK